MDQQQARDLVKGTLERRFDKSRFTLFIKNFLNEVDTSQSASFINQGNYIPDAYKPFISSLERIGKYASGSHAVDVLIVKLKKETAIDRARTMQRNFIARYLNGSRGSKLRDAALVAFVSPDQEDWRFSLVKMDYRFEESKNGRMKVREDFTPARRWSFLVGENENSHTAQARLLPIMADDGHPPTLAELEDAFNIEKVTKEFFEKYRELFHWTKDELDAVVSKDERIKNDFAAKNVNTVDFAKKLLGQIVFLYFLQKKGWFGVGRDQAWGLGSKQFLRELFEKKHGDYNNFFNDILEPLFYEALRIDRSHDDHYYSRFNCKIPFLNGGLFDPMNNYDWVHTDILLSNDLFSNNRKTKEGDEGNGILDIFDRYNFTVKEDEPLEKEVAIDPEMLGKVFENLLEIKDRKSKGTYYTPREIVHYMCRQSLVHYLFTRFNGGGTFFEKPGVAQTDMFGNIGVKGQLDLTIANHETTAIPEKDIETLIHFGERIAENEARVLKEGRETSRYYHQMPESIRNHAQEIDESLASIRVCDPAIGSGAFPVGMMSEIVRARHVLSHFVPSHNRTPYAFKRQCIENCLYGVDLDPGAVEIAKLRLWLSLVVDEDDIREIQPLPNLDYKVVCGNSLLGFPAGWDSDVTKEIESLKREHFSETHPAKKNALKSKIDGKINERYKNSLKTFGYSIDFDFRTTFSEVFHEKKGFDVVIANPPYVRQESIKALKPDLAKVFPGFYCGTADLYTYFYKKGIELLKANAHLCFIAPNKFMRASYGKNTRRLLAGEVTPKQVIDFGDLPIFDATTYPSIILVQKCRARSQNAPLSLASDGLFGEQSLQVATFTDISQIENPEQTIKEIGFKLSPDDLKDEGWTLERPEILALMDKLRKAGKPLGKYVQGRFYRGILTGLNEAFVIDEATREKLITGDPKSAELIKPWLRGRDIKKWKAEWAGLYLITIPSSANKEWPWSKEKTEAKARQIFAKNYPAIHQHLSGHEDKLKKRDDQGQFWWELRSCAYYEGFERPKIVYPDIAQASEFTYDTNGFFLGNTAYIIPINETWLLGVLNSKLIWWFYLNLSSMIRGGFVRFIAQYMEQLPIPVTTNNQTTIIGNHVQKILALEQSAARLGNAPCKTPDSPNVCRAQSPIAPQTDVSKLEAEIDQMVYQLYGLTPEEIAIVERK
jgi:hypothetical protein